MGELLASILWNLLGEILLRLMLYALAFPLLCLVCTPFVLIDACFGKGRYFENAAADYRAICWWIWAAFFD